MFFMEIYHYTCFDSIKTILTNEGIKFKAYHYLKYKNDDYAWSEKIVMPIIKEICEENEWYFDEDEPVDPFLISFCKSENSDYMWECFMNNCDSGVALIFNRTIIEEYAYKDHNPDIFMDCVYLDDIREIKSFLLGCGWDKYSAHTINDQHGDLKDISTFLIKPKFSQELECRYVVPYRKKVVFLSSLNDFIKEKIGNMDYIEIVFPKSALVGVKIGPLSDVKIEEIVEILKQNNYSDDIVIEKKHY